MPRVTFTSDFDYSPSEHKGLVTLAYKSGQTELVKQECADQAIKLCRAHLAEVAEEPTDERRRAPRKGRVSKQD